VFEYPFPFPLSKWLKGGEKMKKRILLSVIVIGTVIAGTALITRAYLSVRQTATGSKFTVGTLDMDVGGQRGVSIEPFVVDNIGQEGNINGIKTWTVNNKGSLPGRLYFRIQDLINNENECNEPETLVDTNCGTDAVGAGLGELGSKLTFKVYLGNTLVSTTHLTEADLPAVRNAWNTLPAVIIPAGESKEVKVEYSATEQDYGNEVQSDSTGFNARFDLVQTTNAAPTPGE